MEPALHQRDHPQRRSHFCWHAAAVLMLRIEMWLKCRIFPRHRFENQFMRARWQCLIYPCSRFPGDHVTGLKYGRSACSNDWAAMILPEEVSDAVSLHSALVQ